MLKSDVPGRNLVGVTQCRGSLWGGNLKCHMLYSTLIFLYFYISFSFSLKYNTEIFPIVLCWSSAKYIYWHSVGQGTIEIKKYTMMLDTIQQHYQHNYLYTFEKGHKQFYNHVTTVYTHNGYWDLLVLP